MESTRDLDMTLLLDLVSKLLESPRFFIDSKTAKKFPSRLPIPNCQQIHQAPQLDIILVLLC